MLKIEGVPEGWEIVRIGKAKAGEYILLTDGKPYVLDADMNFAVSAIVRRIEEPSPGDGWRWVEVGERLNDGDEYFLDSGKWFGITRGQCSVPYRYRRRIGPRLRKVGERITQWDEMQYPNGQWGIVPLGLVGMEIVGGWYRTLK